MQYPMWTGGTLFLEDSSYVFLILNTPLSAQLTIAAASCEPLT